MTVIDLDVKGTKRQTLSVGQLPGGTAFLCDEAWVKLESGCCVRLRDFAVVRLGEDKIPRRVFEKLEIIAS